MPKQTNSREKIEALEDRIENTQQAIEDSQQILNTAPDAEQRGAIEEKNRRRMEAIHTAKQRIKGEKEE
ncbi:hypothetical protein JOD45_002888 [Scopulibacillus daqui]|uniref:Small, acid-soluble spore protein Tlp n=1 Tax=Scopulibacillus daqui TaxID=1469162 RepID=A0ABS2Q3F8_9BACL|nr:hypothetical protein [Scopulibacillus daqui]MBM7646656.1 hypothetical protein [Scopulibacillus daqui]